MLVLKSGHYTVSFAILTSNQAKLKSVHEVVVMNRLEQLRKKQRDEALQAQEELLAGVTHGVKASEAVPEKDDTRLTAPDDEEEPYDRSMSPLPVELLALHPDDRQIETIDELSDRAALVSFAHQRA